MAKPLLFGDATFDAERIDEIRRLDDQWDRSYVPGYSEQRRANEHRVRDGKKPVPTKRLQWIRFSTTDGRDVGDRDMLEWALNGYQFITKDELKENGWGMPPTAHVDAQGRIRREDLVLAFVDEEQARKNKERQDRIREEFHYGRAASVSGNPEIDWEERVDDTDDIERLGERYLGN